jgi:hypothetical protein
MPTSMPSSPTSGRPRENGTQPVLCGAGRAGGCIPALALRAWMQTGSCGGRASATQMSRYSRAARGHVADSLARASGLDAEGDPCKPAAQAREFGLRHISCLTLSGRSSFSSTVGIVQQLFQPRPQFRRKPVERCDGGLWTCPEVYPSLPPMASAITPG